MILFDANVLLNAHRLEQEHHRRACAAVSSPAPFAVSELVLSGFVRIATDSRAFDVPTPLDAALRFADSLRRRSNARIVRAGDRHWPIFVDLCRRTQARGTLIADAHHAALALEHGCE